MKRYPHLVTFQAATEVRSGAGGVTYTYANVSDLTDLPARIIPLVQDNIQDRMVLTRDLFEIVIAGDREVQPAMAAITDYEGGVFDVIRVARPALRPGSPMSQATIVTVERVAA